MKILNKLTIQWLIQQKGQSLLCISGIAIGVTLYLSIQLAVQSAERSFLESNQLIHGKAHGHITGEISRVPAIVLKDLRQQFPGVFFAPVIEEVGSAAGKSFTLLGIDPISDGPFRSFLEGGENSISQLWSGNSAAAFIASGLNRGDEIQFTTSTKILPLVVEELFTAEIDSPGLKQILITDVAVADSLLQRSGMFDRIDVRWRTDYSDDQVQMLKSALPAGLSWRPSSLKQNSVQQMTQAFQTNLLAMSLLALLVGSFLIYNSVSFTVIKRRFIFGQLRYLGMSSAELVKLILREALILGVVGSLLGIIVGSALGYFLLGIVGGTINDLYYSTGQVLFQLPFDLLIYSLVLGVGGSLLAALIPALKAGREKPSLQLARSNEESQSGQARLRLVIAAVVAQLLSILIVQFSESSLFITFLGVFLGLMSASFCIPYLVEKVLVLLHHLSRKLPFLFKVTIVFARQSLSRTGPAVSALALALSIAVSVTLMVQSFRGTLIDWLESSLQADVYVTIAPELAKRSKTEFPADVAEALQSLNGVQSMSSFRSYQIETEKGAYFLLALQLAEKGFGSFDIIKKTRENPWANWCSDQEIFVSEPFANRYNVTTGDRWNILTPAGNREFVISAIFRDFATEQGAVMICRSLFGQYFQDKSLNSFAYYLKEGHRSDELVQQVQTAVQGRMAVSIQENNKIKALSLEIFDRTFRITSVLKLMAMIVAVVAIFGSLLSLLIEIRRESSMLRVLGLQASQLTVFLILQSILLGLCAGLFAMPMGIYLGGLLVEVINYRSFGWTLDFVWSWGDAVDAIYLGAISAFAAALVPAFRQRRLKISKYLREE